MDIFNNEQVMIFENNIRIYGSISLRCLLETRLQSKSFDTLDNLLRFQVQTLWSKVIKIFD